MEKPLMITWMLCAISLAASQSPTTNEIAPSSTTPYWKMATSFEQTPLLTLSEASRATGAILSSSATSIVFTSRASASVTMTATSFHGNAGSADSNMAPSTSTAKEEDAGNVTCSGVGNSTDCKTFNGQEDWTLPTPVIIGLACGAAALVLLTVVVIGVCCARKKQRLSGSKADLSSYWEDNVTLSYINGHVDVPRDYPDEMISLDNDSFLNSLDNMSFTNVWTADNSKHTNF